MARTVFVTKEYVATKLNDETVARGAADGQITGVLTAQSGKLTLATADASAARTSIDIETTNRTAQIGDCVFNASLVKEDGFIAQNLTEAVNASVRIKNDLQTTVSSVDIQGYIALQDQIAGLAQQVTSDKNKIEAILSNSDIDYDSFSEIVNLITTKDAETAASLAVMQASLQALIDTKMDKVQTSTSSLEYIDANDASKKYRILIVDGQLAVEDIA